MYICLCNQVTEKQIKEAISKGYTTQESLSEYLKIGLICGECCQATSDLLSSELEAASQLTQPLMSENTE